jgi:hypothetical protein
MKETKEPPKNPQCLQPIRRDDRKREPHEAVQLLVDVGAIQSFTKDCLEEYLKELTASHNSSQTSLKRIPFATARRFLLMHQQRLLALIKAVKNVLDPPQQHGSFVNNLLDTDMNEPEDNVGEEPTTDEEENGEQSSSHGDSSPSPTPPIEESTIQYVQLPLPKNQGHNELNKDRQSGGRGGNHR